MLIFISSDVTREKQETELVLSIDIHQKPDARLVYNLPITCLSRIRFSLLTASRKESEMNSDKNEGHKEETKEK